MAQKETLQYLSPIISSLLAGARRNPLGVGLSNANFGPARQGGRDFVLTPNKAEQREVSLPSTNINMAVEMAKQMQEAPMDFDAGIVFIPGTPQGNAGFVNSPENRAAFIHQTPEEHREALEKFADNPNIPEDKKIQLGIKNEEGLAKWWNDHNPRRPVTPTSSAVKKARIGANGDIYITFASGNKEYQYEGSPDPVRASEILADLVARPESIGKRVNSWTGDWGTKHTYLPK